MTGSPDRDGQYRADLEGLRAVAVLLVLLYHTHIVGFEGGYVGVDVFFVLSGFFITGVIDRELRRTGGFRLINFYARRARRLLPAAALVLFVTLVASFLVLPSTRIRGASVDIASAGFYVSNIRFGIQANDYFQVAATPSPVLHFWSLSLEEQFYIFWPAILLAAYRLAFGLSERARIGLAIALIGILSLAAGVWMTGVNAPWAFFLLPTRAWELAIGGLLAVQSRELGKLPRRVTAVATPVGIALIVFADLSLNDATPFPGVAALLPVAGSALVIAGGITDRVTPARRALSTAPITYLGRISYSLYLWHWPILVFGTALWGFAMAPVLAASAIVVAGLSQRLVEQPMRYGRLIGTTPSWNIVQAASIAVVISVASLGAWLHILPQPNVAPDLAIASYDAAADGGPQACSGCTIADLSPALDSLQEGAFPPCQTADVLDPERCVVGSPASGRVIAVFGDLFAWHWMPAFDKIGKTQGYRVINMVRTACPPGEITVWSETLKRTDVGCDEWRALALRRIEAEHPSIIIMASSDEEIVVAADGSMIGPDDQTPNGPHTRLWAAGLHKTLTRLASTGARLAIVEQPPRFSQAGLDPFRASRTTLATSARSAVPRAAA